MTHLSVKTLLGSALALGTVGLFVAPTANADSFTAKVSERAIQKSVENRDRGNRGTRDRVRPDRRTGSVDRDRRRDRVDRDRRRDRTERTVVRRDRIRDNRRVHRDFRRASTRHYRNDYRSPIRRSFHTPYRSGLGISFNFGTPGYSPYRWARSDYAFYRPGRISFANYRHNTRCQRILIDGWQYGRRVPVSVKQCYNPFEGHYIIQGSERIAYRHF